MRRAKIAAKVVMISLLSLTMETAEASPFMAVYQTPGAAATAAGTYPGACHIWIKVNDDAFGLPGALDVEGRPADPPPLDPYLGQGGFELLVFNKSLYLGMEAHNQLGARLWRTRPGVVVPWRQSDWEEVVADADGLPFGSTDRAQHDHIDSLAAFQGQMYASVANRDGQAGGFRLYRSPSGDPGTWTDAQGELGPGFGDPANENFKDLQVFEGWLCGGTWNERSGAQVWCSQDGRDWQMMNNGGFAVEGDDPKGVTVWSGHVHDGALYFGLQHKGEDPEDIRDDRAELYRTGELGPETAWSRVFEGAPGSFRADLLDDLNGWLYLATASPAGVQVYRSRSGELGTWERASRPGMNGDPHNLGTVVDGAVVYNGALYLSVTNIRRGLSIWRTSGRPAPDEPVEWERVPAAGLENSASHSAELTVFQGSLYAWTSNDRRGHQVWRTRCPLCQAEAITSAGRYWFDDLGVEIELHAGNLTGLEACVYPDARPDGLPAGVTGPGYLAFRPMPAEATFNATLSVRLEDWPFGQYEALPGAKLGFLHWNGLRWQSCSVGQGLSEGRAGALSCAEVTSFDFPWAVLPVEAQPVDDALAGAMAALLGGGILFIIYVFSRGRI